MLFLLVGHPEGFKTVDSDPFVVYVAGFLGPWFRSLGHQGFGPPHLLHLCMLNEFYIIVYMFPILF